MSSLIKHGDRWWLPLIVLVAMLLSACNSTPASPLDAGREALQAGDAAEAITELEQIIAKQPGSAEAHFLLGQAYFRSDRKDDAKNQFTAGFSLEPVITVTVAITDPEEYFLIGNVHAALGQLDQAMTAYDTVLNLAPSKAGAYTNKGVIYYQLGQLDQAIEQYNKALAIDPADADTHYLLGAALTQQKKYDEAEQAYQAALKLNPNLAPAYVGMGNLYLLRQQYDQAVSALEQANTLEPNLPETLYALGQAYDQLGRKADAVRVLNQFLQLNPAEPFKSDAQKLLQQLNTP